MLPERKTTGFFCKKEDGSEFVFGSVLTENVVLYASYTNGWEGVDISYTGEKIVEFQDNEKKCIACAQCALVCPDIAIEEVIKE